MRRSVLRSYDGVDDEVGCAHARWLLASETAVTRRRHALHHVDLAEQAEAHLRNHDLAFEHGVEFAHIGLGLSARRQGRLDDAERHLQVGRSRWRSWASSPSSAATKR